MEKRTGEEGEGEEKRRKKEQGREQVVAGEKIDKNREVVQDESWRRNCETLVMNFR